MIGIGIRVFRSLFYMLLITLGICPTLVQPGPVSTAPGRLTYRDRNHTSTKPNLPSKNAVPSSERPRAHPTPAGMDSECINIYQKISTWDLFLLSLANHLLSVCFALFLPAFPCTNLRPRHIFSTAHSTSLSALPRSVATLCVLLAGSRPPPQE